MPEKRMYELDWVLSDSPPDLSMVPPGTWATLKRHKKHHQKAGNGFGYSVIDPPFRGEVTRTLSARYHKDGAEILINMEKESWQRPRRLSPLECCKLMGFPPEYQDFFSEEKYIKNELPVSRTQVYRQFGNSVVVPVVTELAKLIADKLTALGEFLS